MEVQGLISQLVRGLACERFRVRFPSATTNSSFDFLPFRVALSSFKHPYKVALILTERGMGGCKMSAPSASGFVNLSCYEKPT